MPDQMSGTRVGPGDASAYTTAANAAVNDQLPFGDREDFEFATRGFIATSPEQVVRRADGAVVWDFGWYDFMRDADAPPTVNPSLWRQAALLTRHGLFRVTDRIYQVRGFDVSNITFIEGDTGYIVVDPLECSEMAAAAYALVKAQIGDKPVKAVIYTHPHPDHFAGVAGVASADDVASGRVMIIAGAGFMDCIASEKVATGNAIARRSLYYQGAFIPKGATGGMTSGLGAPIAVGTTALHAPTDLVTVDGQSMTIDGLEFVSS
jgi:alkyl sulfatase BDS1-like metallo-beta-lactamase superfamily hydrolase